MLKIMLYTIQYCVEIVDMFYENGRSVQLPIKNLGRNLSKFCFLFKENLQF